MKILWLSPVLNHYKSRSLNLLAETEDIDLTVLKGSGRKISGDKELVNEWNFNTIKVNTPKNKFGLSLEVWKSLMNNFKNYDWILIPAEKKNILLLIFAIYLRRFNRGTKLFSYNHLYIKPKKGDVKFKDKLTTKFFYRNLDRIIFYTEQSYKNALKKKLVNPDKAFWANNTIDTLEVNKNYSFCQPPKNPVTIVFIGRLLKTKGVELIINFFQKISKQNDNKFVLEIIGDGPENHIVKQALKSNSNIIWHGTLVDEEKIAPVMKKASLVFVPGLAGLSINHAFAYGRPYATFTAERHGPEISYLKNGENGFIIENNLKIVEEFLNNRKKIEDFCKSAYETSKSLSVNIWLKQIVFALHDKE